jgi:ubiquinone/menaquinone biosynthesis C-methylase UbiE
MNKGHLDYLVSEEWREKLRGNLLPWLNKADLGDDVLEIGPGPGLTTDFLKEMAPRLTALEVDRSLADPLAKRLAGSNVTVVYGDAATMSFETDRFTAVTTFSMLHHVPTPERQDAIFAEISRVLKPGGSLIATDTRDIDVIRNGHQDDVFQPLPPETLVSRLEAAGLGEVQLELTDFEIRFSARKPKL